MRFCWRKHYSGVIENKAQQHQNPHGDRNREKGTQEERQRCRAGVKNTVYVCVSIYRQMEMEPVKAECY